MRCTRPQKTRYLCIGFLPNFRGARFLNFYGKRRGAVFRFGLFRYFDIGFESLDFDFHAVCHVGRCRFVDALVQEFRIEEIFEEVFDICVVSELAEDFRDEVFKAVAVGAPALFLCVAFGARARLFRGGGLLCRSFRGRFFCGGVCRGLFWGR